MKNKKLIRLTIFGVEQTFKNKLWIILNILMIVSIIAFTNFDTVKKIVKLKSSQEDSDEICIMSLDETGMFEDIISKNKEENMVIKQYEEGAVENGNVLVEITLDSKDYISATITSKEYIEDKYYKKIEFAINSVRNNVFSNENNIDLENVEILNNKVDIKRVVTTMDATTYEKYSGMFFIATFVIYMLFIFIASSLASTIGMEKISRTTEYMLTGISENAYLWYNILQTNIVVILQSALSLIYFLVATLIKGVLSKNFLGIDYNILLNSNYSISASFEPILIKAVIVTLVLSILSILILSIVQAVLSSRVNNMSDVSNSTVLVLFFVIFATMIFPNMIKTKENVSIFMKAVSLLPVISTIAIPKLLLLGQVKFGFAILSIILSIAFLILATIIGSKLFKKGLLSINKGSKKEERVELLQKNHLNDSKFKTSISKVAMALIIYLVFSNILGIVNSFMFSNVENATLNYIIAIIIWILGIYPSYWYLKSDSFNYNEQSKNKVSKRKKFVSIVIAFGICFLIQYLNSLFDVEGIDITRFMKLDFSSAINCILAVIEIAVLPAIFEELLFRKAIYGNLKRYGKNLAIIISAVAFGLMHQNLTQGVFAMLLGIILCLLYENTNSIFPCMILHFLNNSIAVIELIILENTGNSFFSILQNIGSILVFASVIFGVLAVIVLKLKKYKFVEEDENRLIIKNPLKIIFTDFMTVVTIFIYLVISICITQML